MIMGKYYNELLLEMQTTLKGWITISTSKNMYRQTNFIANLLSNTNSQMKIYSHLIDQVQNKEENQQPMDKRNSEKCSKEETHLLQTIWNSSSMILSKDIEANNPQKNEASWWCQAESYLELLAVSVGVLSISISINKHKYKKRGIRRRSHYSVVEILKVLKMKDSCLTIEECRLFGQIKLNLPIKKWTGREQTQSLIVQMRSLRKTRN